jgi:hypothetical protein
MNNGQSEYLVALWDNNGIETTRFVEVGAHLDGDALWEALKVASGATGYGGGRLLAEAWPLSDAQEQPVTDPAYVREAMAKQLEGGFLPDHGPDYGDMLPADPEPEEEGPQCEAPYFPDDTDLYEMRHSFACDEAFAEGGDDEDFAED